MAGDKTTGIIFYHPDAAFYQSDAYAAIRDYAAGLPGVRSVIDGLEVDLSCLDTLASVIKKHDPARVVIAGVMPGLIKSAVARVLSETGKDPGNIRLVDWSVLHGLNGQWLELTKAMLASAVAGMMPEECLIPSRHPVHPDTLVIGGGIAGIQASLEVADAGRNVILVEKSGTIGGHMAMFDKTFPTLDCAACILTPKMVEVGQHSMIDLLTCTEVEAVTGVPGDYTVSLLKRARRVNLATCIGCGTCAEKCPRTAPSEFDALTTHRKAIYIPFPQAVPNKYLIDPAHCTYVENGKCGVCVKVCPVPDCINLDEKDQRTEIKVGNIIVATGFQVFDAARVPQYGYGKFPNVLTSLEFERLVNAAGPTGGNITFRSQDKKGNWIFKGDSDTPSRVGIIHCVGSRDENHHPYCSKVCCMYSLKLAHLVKEKLPQASVYEYFIDMRAFGKGYEEFYERIKEEGVHIIRGRTAKVEERNGKLMMRSEDILNDRLIEQEVDMVILAVGLEPREDAAALAASLGISRSNDGWFAETNRCLEPSTTFTGGISIAGVCQGPKDIPDTVAQASAAAARVLQSLVSGEIAGSIKAVGLQTVEDQIKNK
ncbi:MAG TPA: CoB--CoM heterodisulfide reductase iron-sulfur subunit A family protein [Bacteroidales bacterium]|nr:CoB--CoM heterodisulfide reductase iron-sulfur subunit A family protein [Bacteroidales bacterium]HSA42417.1 CoB--CoM heterodisulfide reductase iron-sulfur subunit A family protein [Bacteroidales bacterium]